MTIASTLTKKHYEGNGITKEFPLPFHLVDKTHIFAVIKKNKEIQEVTKNFSVDLVKKIFTYPLTGEALPKGTKLTIYRKVPLTQIVDLENAGAFHPEVLENDGFDRIVMQIQQLDEEISRALKLDITDERDKEGLVDALLTARDEAVQAAINAKNSELSASKSEVNAKNYAKIAKAWAESPTPPDSKDPHSKSAKEWAKIASDTVPIASYNLAGKIKPTEQTLSITKDGSLSVNGYNRGWLAEDLSKANAGLSGDTDLNTVVKGGFYHVNGSNDTSLNRPVKNPILLQVFGYGAGLSTGRITQIAYCLYATQKENFGVYTRSYFNGVWSDWVQLWALNVPQQVTKPISLFTNGNLGILAFKHNLMDIASADDVLRYLNIEFYDKNDNRVAFFTGRRTTQNHSYAGMSVFNANGKSATLSIDIDNDGVASSYAPTPNINGSRNQIATLGTVNNAGILKKLGERSTNGDWTLSNLTIGKPLKIYYANSGGPGQFAQVNVVSGAEVGLGTGSYLIGNNSIPGYWNNISTDLFETVPTSQKVVINVAVISGKLIAYQ